jgi:hypothetical protein
MNWKVSGPATAYFVYFTAMSKLVYHLWHLGPSFTDPNTDACVIGIAAQTTIETLWTSASRKQQRPEHSASSKKAAWLLLSGALDPLIFGEMSDSSESKILVPQRQSIYKTARPKRKRFHKSCRPV